jgi:hypothetical protein
MPWERELRNGKSAREDASLVLHSSALKSLEGHPRFLVGFSLYQKNDAFGLLVSILASGLPYTKKLPGGARLGGDDCGSFRRTSRLDGERRTGFRDAAFLKI